MIDSHCHLDLLASGKNLEVVLDSAVSNGLSRIMAPSVHPESWRELQNIADQYRNIIPIDSALGLHPYFLDANDALPSDKIISHQLSLLEEAALARHASVKAIGETGVDGHIDTPVKLQQRVFNAHLALAERISLPIIVHHRKSHHLLLECFKQSNYQGIGVIHAFSGSVEVAKGYIERGFYLGIGGTITYERAKKTRQTLGYLLEHHIDRLLLETDAPDMPMCGRQGELNEPCYLTDVVDAISKLYSVEKREVITVTTRNYFRLFGDE